MTNYSKSQNKFLFTFFSLFLLFSTVISSCNNSDKKSDTSKTDTTTVMIDKQESTQPIDTTTEYTGDDTTNSVDPKVTDATWYMKLPATQLKKLFQYGTASDNNIRQLRFKFVQSGENWGLKVQAKSRNGFDGLEDTLETIKTMTPVPNTNKLERRHQRLSRGELKDIFGATRYENEPIPDSLIVDLYVKASIKAHPDNPKKKYIYLIFGKDLSALEKEKLDGTGISNPSPPKGACLDLCDNPPAGGLKKKRQ